MTKAKLIFNEKGNTLDIWFENPKNEVMNEETKNEVILKKDRKGKIIGIEILNFIKEEKVLRELPVQLVAQ